MGNGSQMEKTLEEEDRGFRKAGHNRGREKERDSMVADFPNLSLLGGEEALNSSQKLMCRSSTSSVEMVVWDLCTMSLTAWTRRPQIQGPW
ncbi:hypothetical protein SLEP1_g41041 [Rubroshorea leprosula]|uniref:Uncharacterized protein n=1 Tax=Rubroshorea leprosula TaxID=152421 RepID=A0AAV5L5A9_9ROSI|nr:hypothetical protein SLEP1_g41041 [Rubroshorea leprosula]